MKLIALISFLLVPFVFLGQFSAERILSQTDILDPFISEIIDFDNDGDKDIVVSNYSYVNTAELYWFENIGNNIFGEKKTIFYEENDVGRFMKVCDINNDYIPDIIFSTQYHIYAILNFSNENYNVVTVSNIYARKIISAADFDNDNDIDIIFNYDNNIKLIRNDGFGNFAVPVNIASASNSASFLYTADFNNDNFPDILAHLNQFVITWYPNDQTGGFGSPQIISDQDSLNRTTYGDIDNDGDIDIIGSGGEGSKFLMKFINDGNGVFNEIIIDSINIEPTYYVLLKDLDNDNDNDLIILQDSYYIYWYENTGFGNFNNKQLLSNEIFYLGFINSDDLNNDGYNDIILSTLNSTSGVIWLENLQNGHFSIEKQIAENAEYAFQIISGDLDNDQDFDFAMTRNYKCISYMRNIGFGKFSKQEVIRNSYDNILTVDIGDIDGDGDDDIIGCSNSWNQVYLTKNIGNGIFDSITYVIDSTSNVWIAKTCDIDGDNDLDILEFGNNIFKWIENDGTGIFPNSHFISDSYTLNYVFSYNLVDFDNDGDFDFIANPNLDSLFLFENDGVGNFTKIGIIGYFSDGYTICADDLDIDGDKDIVLGTSSGINLYENLGNYMFSEHNFFFGGNVRGLKIDDIDGDGLKDIVIGVFYSAPFPESIYWIKNLGGLIFSQKNPISQTNLTGVNYISLQDYDSDGDFDIAAALLEANQFIYYENCFISRFKIIGSVFYDENQNGIRDIEDTITLNMSIILFPNYMVQFNNTNGTYTLAVDTGSYYLTTGQDSLWNLTSPYSSFNVDINYSNPVVDTCNFGFYPATIVNDIEVNLTSGTQRCDFNANHWININNTGTKITRGIIELKLDSLISYVSSVSTPDSIIGTSIFWHYDNLSYYENEQIQLVVHMPDFTYMDSTISSIVNVFCIDSLGNIEDTFSDTLTDILECSIDPNNKTGYPIGIGNEHYIQNTQKLEYTIRFQNTGNSEAVNVMIRDMLDQNLNKTTINIIASSFPVDVVLEYDNEIVFRFDSIMLPDNSTSEINSNGFVTFSISPLDSLMPNTTIENTAEIYFDYNPPIITNNTLHTIECWTLPQTPVIYDSFGILYVSSSNSILHWYLNDTILFGELDTFLVPQYPGSYTVEAINEYGCSVFSQSFNVLASVLKQNDNIEILIYPNPTFGSFRVQAEGIKMIEVLNTQGTTIYCGNDNEINLNKNSKGVYIVKVRTERGVAVEKVILD